MFIILWLLGGQVITQDDSILSEPRLLDSKTTISDQYIWSGETTQIIFTTHWINTQDYFFTYTTEFDKPGIILQDIDVYTSTAIQQDRPAEQIQLVYTIYVDDDEPSGFMELPGIDLIFSPKLEKLRKVMVTRNLEVTEENIRQLNTELSIRTTSHIKQLGVTHPLTIQIITTIGMILGSLLCAVFIVLIIYYLAIIRKQRIIEQGDELPEDYPERIYQKFLEAKVHKTRRGLKHLIPITRMLITQFILRKAQVRRLEDFFKLKQYDDQIKEGVTKFFMLLDNLQYGKQRMTTQDLEHLENEVKTVLFVL